MVRRLRAWALIVGITLTLAGCGGAPLASPVPAIPATPAAAPALRNTTAAPSVPSPTGASAPLHTTGAPAATSTPAIQDAPAALAAPTVPSPTGAPAPPPTTAAPSAAPNAIRRSEHWGTLGAADGVIPAGTTVFDDEIPGVAKLDPALHRALRQAATAAADDGVAFVVTSGWRSPAYQAQLLQEAVAQYGSEEEAARWVATPATSAHVAGDAVDLGPVEATAWLVEHGAAYGLCPIYRNEPWHYELRPAARAAGCPPLYADATHDPRMQP